MFHIAERDGGRLMGIDLLRRLGAEQPVRRQPGDRGGSECQSLYDRAADTGG